MRRLLLVFCLLSLTPQLYAQTAADEEVAVTGRELLADCESDGLSAGPTRECMQYIGGLVQTVVMLQQMEPGEQLFCIDPTLVSLEEVSGAVTRWLKNAPTRLDEDAYILVSEALNAAYPCSAAEVI